MSLSVYQNSSSLSALTGTTAGEPTKIATDEYGQVLTKATAAVVTTSATATLSNVASSASSVTILAANTSRKGVTVFNDSTANLYLKLGSSAASTSSFSVKIAAGGYWEIPTAAIYTGQITGIWDAANGNARVTELT